MYVFLSKVLLYKSISHLLLKVVQDSLRFKSAVPFANFCLHRCLSSAFALRKCGFRMNPVRQAKLRFLSSVALVMDINTAVAERFRRIKKRALRELLRKKFADCDLTPMRSRTVRVQTVRT